MGCDFFWVIIGAIRYVIFGWQAHRIAGKQFFRAKE